jgi:tape measure domain-containing protein
MAPTGFDSGSIEKLFTGISAATAALQLTPDKAERVIYAFGQMASKGQIMSEELKGQLGDVLPGALAIFAKSAGMSVKEFSKAMEDGEFVGSRFREVFAKVSDELMTRFGTGAQAAGKSLQGLLSTVGGDFQRTLESFAPLANNVAQAILVPLGGALRQLSTSAQIAMGEMDRVKGQYQAAKIDLGDLRAGGASADQIRAAEQNVAALEARYKSLNKALEDPAIAKQVKDIQLFTQELTKAGIFVMNVAKAIGGILSPVINFLGTNLTATIATITSFYIGFQAARLAAMALMGVLLLYRGLSAMLGLSTAAQQATALSGAFNVLGVSASRANVALIGTRVALTALVAATVVGAVVAGIVAIASAFATMGDKARDAAQASKDAGKAAMDAASTGNVAAAEMGVQAVLAESRKNTAARKALEAIQRRSTVDQRKGAVPMSITSEESVALQGSALTAGMIKAGVSRGGVRQIQALTKELMDTTLKQFGSLAGQAAIDLQEAKSAVNQARKVSVETGLNKPTPNPLTEDEDTKKKQNLESYYSLQDTLAKNAANFAAAQAEEDSNHRIELLERYYDIQEARANAYQKDAIRFEREMVMIEAKRQEARLKAELDVQRAQSSVAGGAPGVGATATGAAKLPGSISGRLDASGQNGADMPVGPNNTIQSYHNGLVKALGTAGNNGNYIVIDFIDDLGNRLEATYSHVAAAVKVGQSVVGGQTIGRFDASGRTTGPHNSIDINSPGNNGSLQRGRETSAAQRSADILVAGNVQGQVSGLVKTAPAKVTGNEKRDAVATQKTLQASIAQTATDRRADAKAAQEQIVAFEKYRAAAFPTTEQDLQNKLLTRRNELFRSGMTDERIDQEIKLYENQERGAAGLAVLDRLLTKKILTDTQHATLTKELNQDISNQNNLLQQNATLIGQSKFDQALKGLRNQIDMAKALTPEQEMRTQIKQEGYMGAEAESILQERKILQSAEKLKADLQGIASTIGTSFGDAFKGIITGSMTAQEALAGFFQSLSNYFADMVSKMIADWLRVEAINGLKSLLGGLGGMFGGGGGSSGFFGAGAPDAVAGGGIFSGAGPYQFANGGIAAGGFRAFATGGIVTGPTLGLVGEGRYNEAVIPLPDGKSVPVDLGGEGARLGGNGGVSVGEINITVQNTGDTLSPAAQKQIAGQVQGIVLATMADQRRSGGLLR